MKKSLRLVDSDDFAIVVKKGQTLKNESYIIHFMNNNESNCRVGIAVSSKVGNAVTRNRCKRQIRSMCDKLINFDNKKDIVIITRNKFLDYDYKTNYQMLDNLLLKIMVN